MISRPAGLAAFYVAILGPVAAWSSAEEDPPVPDGSHLLKLEVSTAKEFRWNGPVALRIKVTNLTPDTVVYSHVRRTHSLFRLDVVDEFKQVIPDTRFRLYGEGGTVIWEALTTGKTREYEVPLDAVKDLSEPGLYTLKVGMFFRANSERRGHFRVTSEPITLRILKDPDPPLLPDDPEMEKVPGDD